MAPSRVAHPPPEEALSSVVGENQQLTSNQHGAYINELLNLITESNYQCYVAQKDVFQQRSYIMTLEAELAETREKLERATELLNQKHLQIIHLQEEINYLTHLLNPRN